VGKCQAVALSFFPLENPSTGTDFCPLFVCSSVLLMTDESEKGKP
jgi:hypothetical protein